MAGNYIKIGQKYKKESLTMRKGDEIENPYLNTQLPINMCSQI